jgi:hypothetical protein
LQVDTVVPGTAGDRGAIIGFTGAQITTTSGSPTIMLTTAPTSGGLIVGQVVSGTGIPAGSTISALACGTANTAGATYTLSASATAAGKAVAMTSGGPQQIMAANAARRGFAVQMQSAGNCWLNSQAGATLDFHSLKIPAAGYYDTLPIHVDIGAVSVNCDTAAQQRYGREF